MHPFTSLAQATWIGSPDSAGTTVLYLLSKPSVCSATSWAAGGGWDTKVPVDTLMLEIKLSAPPPTTFPTTYNVVLSNPALSAPPTAGHAFAFFNKLTGAQPVPESSASGGTITISAVNAGSDVKGSLSLTFSGGGTLSGAFDATYCAGAGEP